jgi:hypothetical protein
MRWELVDSLVSVCVPFAARGLRGKKSTPSVGWEVLVKSHQSTSGSFMEHVEQRLGAVDFGIRYASFILHGRLLIYLTLSFMYF